MLFTIVLSAALMSIDPPCPQGAEYAGTASDLPGAVGIAALPVRDAAAGISAEAVGSIGARPPGTSGGFVVCVPGAIEPAHRLVEVRPSFDAAEIERPQRGDYECPIAVDVRADGAVVVADAAGYLTLLDGAERRTLGEGALEEPSGVAFHPKGLAVSDRRARSVVLMDADGSVLSRLGAGQLGDPRGLAALDDGSVLVADRLRDCVWRFAAGNDLMPSQVGVAIGEFGSNPGQFNAPGDVAAMGTASSACILVADELNHRIQILDASGRFAGFFGMHALVPRMGEGHIHYPRAIAISQDGETLAVAEAFEDRVQFFRLTPEPPPPGVPQGAELISSHFGTEVACAGDLLALVDVESEAVGVLDARTTPPIHMTLMGGGGASPQRFREVAAIAIEPISRRVWIADRGRETVDVYDLLWDPGREPVVDLFMPRLARSMRLDVLRRRLASSDAGVRTPDPADLAFADAGAREVLLLDRANLAVLATDARFGSAKRVALPPEARTPEELVVATDGRWAVVDPTARAVFLRAPGGEWSTMRALGGVGLVRPSGFAFLSDGGFAISDAARDVVLVGAPEGPVRIVGGKGVLDEQFWDPQAIAPSPRGEIVVDRGNHRFQRFGDGFEWNLTGSMGRYYDRKRRGSPGGPPLAPVGGPTDREGLDARRGAPDRSTDGATGRGSDRAKDENGGDS